MKSVFKFLIYLALTALVFIFHMAAAGLLFFPFNRINVIFLFLILMNNYWTNGRALWLAIPSIFFLEIFSSMPYGLNSVSFFMGLIGAHWISRRFLTNRSVTAIFLSCFAGLFIYRFFCFLILSISRVFNEVMLAGLAPILTAYGAEIVITSCVAALLYSLSIIFIKKLSPRYFDSTRIKTINF